MLSPMILPAGDASCRSFAVLFSAVVLLLFALPVGAEAKPGYRAHPGGTKLILPVENRADAVISVSADDRQRVGLAVEGPSSGTEYSTKGRVSGRRIEADFGDLGRVDVTLHFVHYRPGFTHPGRFPGRCQGRAPREGIGTYRGAIELSHEGAVPEVSVKSGRVFFTRRFRQVCKRLRPKFEPGPFPNLKRKAEEAILTVTGKGEGRTVNLDAQIFALRQHPARSAGHVYAAAYERHEGVRITRTMGGFFERGSFVMSKRGKQPETITVEPPDPFAGQALYSHSPGSTASWTGDLTVDLPGAARIPLTGPGFTAAVCRGKVDDCRLGGSSSRSQDRGRRSMRGTEFSCQESRRQGGGRPKHELACQCGLLRQCNQSAPLTAVQFPSLRRLPFSSRTKVGHVPDLDLDCF